MAADSTPYADRADAWLVARCRESDDEEAFVEVVRRYRTPVFRLAVSILGQEFAPDAEDVAQDVMLRVHATLRSLKGDAALGAWIYRITFNHALNVKSRVRYRVPHLDERALETAVSPGPGPERQLQDDRRRRMVQACVDELPDVYQAALRLHYWLGTSMTEIATMLDVPENTVKSYLYRARRLLQAMLTERGIDAP